MSVCSDESRAKSNGPLSQKVLEYRDIFKTIVDKGRQPGFSKADFAPLAELVAVEEFERVGCFKEVSNWDDYVTILVQWMPNISWHSRFRRISEVPGLVFLELEEFSTFGDKSDAVYTTTVYEFNADNKLRHLDIYMSREIEADASLTDSWSDAVAPVAAE